MKKLIILLCLMGSLFADYKVTQINHGSNLRNKVWVTETYNSVDRKRFVSYTSNTTCLMFKNKKTNKWVYVSMPFTIEEL